MKLSKEEEMILVDDMRSGSTEAMELLIHSVTPLAYLLAGRIARRKSQIEDLRQEAVICVWKSLKLFDPSMGRMTTYVARYMKWELPKIRARITDAIQRPQQKLNEGPRRVGWCFETLVEDSGLSEVDDRDEKIRQKELLEKAIEILPEENQAVVRLKLQNLTRNEIAEKLGKPYWAVRDLEQKAIAILRRVCR
jgi:RNA polymerase sigma factor (sigma-70 family)